MPSCYANEDAIQIVESAPVMCSVGGAYLELARTANLSRGGSRLQGR
jgi:hypothetical protein